MTNDVNILKPEVNNSFGIDSNSSIGPVNDFAAFDSDSYTPCVRYGLITDEGFTQEYKLTPIDEQPPDNAEFVSPAVYFVSDDQNQRLTDGTPPKTIQKECQNDGRAFFNVIAESDALEDSIAGETVAEWLIEFAEEYIETENYDLYYSGNRSLHLHTDMWVKYENLGKLKGLAQSCMDETDARLDTSIYSGVPQFRMVGAKHRKTGLYKVPISENFTRTNLIQQSQSEPGIARNTNNNSEENPHYVASIPDRESLIAEIGDHLLTPHIKGGSEVDEKWDIKPFSPYALTGGGDYSVCLMTHDNLVERNGKHYARGKVHEALGANGKYNRHDSHSEVLLSGRDADKWDYDSGDTVVIIGGQSRSSKLIEVDEYESILLDDELQKNGRESTLDLLGRFGYDTGKRGASVDNYRDSSTGSTDAANLKYDIDSGRKPSSYDNVFSVSCRLLRVRGWSGTMDWIEKIQGSQFDYEESHDKLSGIVEHYPDYSDVSVPPVETNETDDGSGVVQNDI